MNICLVASCWILSSKIVCQIRLILTLFKIYFWLTQFFSFLVILEMLLEAWHLKTFASLYCICVIKGGINLCHALLTFCLFHFDWTSHRRMACPIHIHLFIQKWALSPLQLDNSHIHHFSGRVVWFTSSVEESVHSPHKWKHRLIHLFSGRISFPAGCCMEQ